MLSDIKLNFIETPTRQEKIKAERQKENIKMKAIKKTYEPRDKYTEAKALHREAIVKARAERAKLKRDIKRHKLLIKQAKSVMVQTLRAEKIERLK